MIFEITPDKLARGRAEPTTLRAQMVGNDGNELRPEFDRVIETSEPTSTPRPRPVESQEAPDRAIELWRRYLELWTHLPVTSSALRKGP